MTTLILICAGALVCFGIGLVLGAAIGGGARADQDFQDYVSDKKSDI